MVNLLTVWITQFILMLADPVELSQYILKDTMYITASHTVRSLTDDEDQDLNVIHERDKFMVKCRYLHSNKLKVGNKTAPKVETVTDNEDRVRICVADKPVEAMKQIPEQDVVDNNGKPIDGLDHIVDSYIKMEVRLQEGKKELYGKVVGLCLDKEGRMIGNPDSNPYMNTVLYEIKFEDGISKAYGANTIAENMQ